MAIRYAPKGARKSKERAATRPAPKPSRAKPMRASRKRPALPAAIHTHSLVSLQPFQVTLEEIGKLNTFAEFRQAGFVILRRSVDAVIWFAELLWQGKQRLTPDEFEQLQRDLQVAATTASQYVTTAKSERIRKLREDDADLPAAAHTLYLLASLSDAEYKAFLKEHKITKDLTVTEIRQFRTLFKERAELAHLPKTTRAAEQQATEEAANEATAPIEEGADPHEFAQAPEIMEGMRGEPGEGSNPGDAYATFKELGEGILEISKEAIEESFHNIDADEAESRYAFVTSVTDHIADLHKLVSDLQFALSNP
jgi:hypothetical protein